MKYSNVIDVVGMYYSEHLQQSILSLEEALTTHCQGIWRRAIKCVPDGSPKILPGFHYLYSPNEKSLVYATHVCVLIDIYITNKDIK